jgi:hypothetical protein
MAIMPAAEQLLERLGVGTDLQEESIVRVH